MPSSSSPSLLKSILLQDEWVDPKLALHFTIFLGLLLLGAIQHFVLRAGGRAASKTGRDGTTEDARQRPRDGGEGEEEEAAVVDSIHIYPIKSCKGSRVDSVELLKKGLELDRNWAIVGTEKHLVLSLRQEAKLTLIQPSIDEEAGLLTVSLAPQAGRDDLKPFTIPLRPSQDELKRWDLLPELPMWGDAADGRVVQALGQTAGTPTPAEWLTEFLGYPATLVQFDTTPSSATRISHPIYRTPQPGPDVPSLQGPRGIHFADEYPLLVATVESLQALEDKVAEEVEEQAQEGARRAIAGLDPLTWSVLAGKGGDDLSNSITNSPFGLESREARSDKPCIDMLRFRPNIVLKGRISSGGSHQEAFPPFSEESWETLWFLPARCTSETPPSTFQQEADHNHHGKLHLVARCARCPLTTVNPSTADRDRAIPLRLLARDGWRMRVKVTTDQGYLGERDVDRRQPCFGMYACPVPLGLVDGAPAVGVGGDEDEDEVSYGRVQVGDRVRVRWRKEETEESSET
ncbi:unnamed protein product [Tilletia laevis]|uniref:MOSC domain-containing protein n=2 Tax=Tilletia TaxID=13289 RepID=A0A177UII1_9BASI|nr:hypothetical protein CF336_g6047 [Tilletia laevis]KAE8253226.1 hypothetical protein A4X03_0g5956 [Tilletia caries]CAD6922097.1 unnamed protein product [Tilletia controversa]KAE8194469.1 hypothetical protein CF335_g5337 [Tilletia laevis]CAD6893930.1 unnamed protein product [Tilletia caries]